MHKMARKSIPPHMTRGTSFASFGPGLAAGPAFVQNIRYPAWTRQTVVKKAAIAEMIAAPKSTESARAMNMVNLLIKPLKGGMPPKANPATKKQKVVTFIFFGIELSPLILLEPAA